MPMTLNACLKGVALNAYGSERLSKKGRAECLSKNGGSECLWF